MKVEITVEEENVLTQLTNIVEEKEVEGETIQEKIQKYLEDSVRLFMVNELNTYIETKQHFLANEAITNALVTEDDIVVVSTIV